MWDGHGRRRRRRGYSRSHGPLLLFLLLFAGCGGDTGGRGKIVFLVWILLGIKVAVLAFILGRWSVSSRQRKLLQRQGKTRIREQLSVKRERRLRHARGLWVRVLMVMLVMLVLELVLVLMVMVRRGRQGRWRRRRVSRGPCAPSVLLHVLHEALDGGWSYGFGVLGADIGAHLRRELGPHLVGVVSRFVIELFLLLPADRRWRGWRWHAWGGSHRRWMPWVIISQDKVG
jgi:hypothetical protein